MPVSRVLPTATPTIERKNAIQAAVDAYNQAHPGEPLPPSSLRLLLAMFPLEDRFHGSQKLLRSAGGTNLPAMLRALVAAGLLERRRGRPDSYRLLLP